MGTILSSYGDAGYGHEGYVGQLLDDGTITGTYSSSTIPRMTGQVVAACGCGWTGTTRYPTMLEPREIAAAMAFAPGYRVLGSKRDQVRQLGNAVTPPAAEFLLRAVVASLNGDTNTGGGS